MFDLLIRTCVYLIDWPNQFSVWTQTKTHITCGCIGTFQTITKRNSFAVGKKFSFSNPRLKRHQIKLTGKKSNKHSTEQDNNEKRIQKKLHFIRRRLVLCLSNVLFILSCFCVCVKLFRFGSAFSSRENVCVWVCIIMPIGC